VVTFYSTRGASGGAASEPKAHSMSSGGGPAAAQTHTHLKSLGMGIATGLMQNRREDGVRAKGPKGPQDRAPPRNLAARHNHKRQDLHRRSEAALLCGLPRLARRRVIKERRQRLAERSSRRPDPRPAAVVFVAGADTAAY